MACWWLADSIGVSAVGLADFSASHNGALAYRGGQTGARKLLWRDRSGRELGQVGEPAEYRVTSFSPEGQRIVVDVVEPDGGNTDLWIHDLERGVASRFTFDEVFDGVPLWSPDGSRIVFSSSRGEGSDALYWKDASGAGAAELLLQAEEDIYPSDWSRDGSVLAFMRYEDETRWDIWALPMDGRERALSGPAVGVCGGPAGLFSRWAMAGLQLERIGRDGGLRDPVSGPRREVAGVDKRRPGTSVER
jgi:Tol biopolymer transport system component